MVACAATFKGDAVNAASKVNKHHITKLGFTGFFNFLGRPIFISQAVHSLVNLINIRWQGWALYRNRCQIWNADLRHHLNHQLGNQILAIFIGNDVQTRLACQL